MIDLRNGVLKVVKLRLHRDISEWRVSLIEGAITLSRTHRDVNVIKALKRKALPNAVTFAQRTRSEGS
ncbi:MAG: hypothetical protein QGG36_24725 [Pirellulaceae bacterium]|jgi:hypothetical protein|nr:hypothetical protein [Pirellulaceae bacterium]